MTEQNGVPIARKPQSYTPAPITLEQLAPGLGRRRSMQSANHPPPDHEKAQAQAQAIAESAPQAQTAQPPQAPAPAPAAEPAAPTSGNPPALPQAPQQPTQQPAQPAAIAFAPPETEEAPAASSAPAPKPAPPTPAAQSMELNEVQRPPQEDHGQAETPSCTGPRVRATIEVDGAPADVARLLSRLQG